MTFEIKEEDYRICEYYSSKLWCNTKQGVWGKGLINSNDDPFKVERIGLLGEMAFSKKFNLDVNFEMCEGGVDNDFFLSNISVNVKTAARNYGKALVKYMTSRKEILELKSDIYVFAYCDDDFENKKATIHFVGFELKNEILKKWEVKPAIKGNHFNKSAYYNQLRPFEHLYWICPPHCLKRNTSGIPCL